MKGMFARRAVAPRARGVDKLITPLLNYKQLAVSVKIGVSRKEETRFNCISWNSI